MPIKPKTSADLEAIVRTEGSLRILVGVGGGIAAYKSCELVRRLRDAGCSVRVVMTESAIEFVSALTFQALSNHPVRSTLFDAEAESGMDHIALARWPDRIVIAPATANLIARLAHGFADDLLTTLCLASEAPILIAPAMNRVMWEHAATQHNLALLRARGVSTIGPGAGSQACGEIGLGRMAEAAEIVDRLLATPAAGPLAGQQVVITAGPTHEPLDPVRYLGNRSSGAMGVALAKAATAAGARVTLVHGPLRVAVPAGIATIGVETAEQMLAAVMQAISGAALFVGAAAVADYRPAETSLQKLKKGEATATLSLVRNPDILATVAGLAKRPFVVGFAAETENLETYARGKMVNKNLDMIAANDVSAGQGFGATDNALHVFWDGGSAQLERQPKESLSAALLALIAERMQAATKEDATC
jgi:phosphopantothenoylcysteine decarboxylase/phosphopantothenate--cysteine ligase